MIPEVTSSSTFYSFTPLSLGACSVKKSVPVQTVEEIKGTRTVVVPVTKIVKTQVPITKAVTTQVPIQKAICGTKEVVSHVVVNKKKIETFTKLVPVQATRIVNVPTVEKRVKKVPTINYVTEYVTKVDYVTELEERLKSVTDYETKTIPTIRKRIRTRYETIEDLPESDLTC
jgi:hypothetical protein